MYSQVPRLVKVSQIDTPYFKIISPADSHHKVGPGLSITFVLQFTPEENKVNEIKENFEEFKY
jgi:hydrocephalus-inducing protein